jgi:hypothetical protein
MDDLVIGHRLPAFGGVVGLGEDGTLKLALATSAAGVFHTETIGEGPASALAIGAGRAVVAAGKWAVNNPWPFAFGLMLLVAALFYLNRTGATQ